MSDKKQFTVVLRGSSTGVFPEDDSIHISNWMSATGPVAITYRTRHITNNSGAKVVGNMWIEVIGQANSVDECVVSFANAGISILPAIALATNAATGHFEVELAYESTPDSSTREFFQSFIAPEGRTMRPARPIDSTHTANLIKAIQAAEHRQRIIRAVNQYHLSLQNWRHGYETLSVAHLWMSVEALTKAVCRVEQSRRGVDNEKALALEMGIDLKKLDSTIRESIILHGDGECYREAVRASDGFEHGFLEFDEMHSRASKIRDRLAAYVRGTIFDLAGISGETRRVFTSPPYDQPIGNWTVIRYLRGRLIGKGGELAPPENAYPFIRWSTEMVPSQDPASGDIEIREKLTPELGEGITFEPLSYQAWKP